VRGEEDTQVSELEHLVEGNDVACHPHPVAPHRTRVLLLTDAFLPHAGGSREYYHNIYRELVSLGDSEVTILTKKVPGWEAFDERVSVLGFRIQRCFRPLPSWKYYELPKGIGPFLQALWHAIRGCPDIVHAGDLYPQGLTALILKKIFGLPYVVYCHGEEITQTDKYRYQPVVRDRIYKAADAVIANSEFARKQLLRIGVEKDRIHKINPGVDANRFRHNSVYEGVPQHKELQGKTVILTVARLVPRKGHRAALEAFATVCNEYPSAHYLIVGTGPEESRLHQAVQDSGLQDRVTFVGHVSGEDLPQFYNACDIMLLANRQEADGDIEGFGIVFLEANASGKPVIGGRSGGATEAVVDGETGILVDSDNPDELAAALRCLLGDPEMRRKLGKAGSQRVRSEFDWKSRAQLLRQVNESILMTSETQKHMNFPK